MKKYLAGFFAGMLVLALSAAYVNKYLFNGLDVSLANLYRLSNAQTRSITPENFTGEKGKGAMATLEDEKYPNRANNAFSGRHLGQGWKLNPYIRIQPGQTFTIADVTGPGAIQHIWMTMHGSWRFSILRIYWDGEQHPSVEVPAGDFFGQGWGKFAQISSIPVSVNPGNGFNCYWVMPFRKKCRITVENIHDTELIMFYQIDYTLTTVPDDAAYYHAQFRCAKPTKNSLYTLLDNVKGKGQYIGTYMAFEQHKDAWWGEGQLKFFMDGDKDFPTIVGTGTEDYFGGSYNFGVNGHITPYTTPYLGLPQVLPTDGRKGVGNRYGMYRWHVQDPIRFNTDLKVTVQDLGLVSSLKYVLQQSHIATVVHWYQTEPHTRFPALPGKEDMAIKP